MPGTMSKTQITFTARGRLAGDDQTGYEIILYMPDDETVACVIPLPGVRSKDAAQAVWESYRTRLGEWVSEAIRSIRLEHEDGRIELPYTNIIVERNHNAND